MGHKGWAQSWAHHDRSVGLKPNWQRYPAKVQQVLQTNRDAGRRRAFRFPRNGPLIPADLSRAWQLASVAH